MDQVTEDIGFRGTIESALAGSARDYTGFVVTRGERHRRLCAMGSRTGLREPQANDIRAEIRAFSCKEIVARPMIILKPEPRRRATLSGATQQVGATVIKGLYFLSLIGWLYEWVIC